MESKEKKRKEKEFRLKSLAMMVTELTLVFSDWLGVERWAREAQDTVFFWGKIIEAATSPARGHQTVMTNSEMVIRKRSEEESTRVHEGKKSVDWWERTKVTPMQNRYVEEGLAFRNVVKSKQGIHPHRPVLLLLETRKCS